MSVTDEAVQDGAFKLADQLWASARVTPKLAMALVKAQSEMDAAAKDGQNPHFKSNFATLASIIDACRPALAKHGLAVLTPTTSRDGVVTVHTLLMHESGEWLRSEMSTENCRGVQAIGSAESYLRRYGQQGALNIATEDDDGHEAQREYRDAPPRKTPPKTQAPARLVTTDKPADGKPGPGWENGTKPDPRAGDGPRGAVVREGGRVSTGAAKAGELGPREVDFPMGAVPNFADVNDLLKTVVGYGGDDGKSARRSFWLGALAMDVKRTPPSWNAAETFAAQSPAIRVSCMGMVEDLLAGKHDTGDLPKDMGGTAVREREIGEEG